jgi:glycosyltransferase involved in cell wall biosynthesis
MTHRGPVTLIRRLAAATRAETRELRALRPAVGTRRAIVARVKAQLELEGVDGALLEGLGGAAHEERQSRQALERDLRTATDRLDRLEAGDAAGRLTALELNGAEDRLARQALAMTAWVSQLEQSDTPVSVVMTTRGRPGLVRRAIRSVTVQTHAHWELVVACDFQDSDTMAALDEFDDIRVVRVDRNGRNRGEALNLALERTTGALVAYLDDDNVMLPHYLRALVWAFAEHPEADIAHTVLVRQRDGETLPTLEFHPWNPRLLVRGNLIDHNAISHRRGIAEERFAEDLAGAHDWERLERMTAGRPPLRVPVLATIYNADAPGRMSDEPGAIEGYRVVRRRLLRRSRLRVLASNQMFPLVTETYINDELEALVDQGVELAYYRDMHSPAPMPVPRTVYTDFDTAVLEFQPDLVMLYWATYAETQVARLEALGLPFGVRVHSFDHDPERVARLRDHPQCIGVWGYPSDAFRMPGVHELAPIFTSVRDMPPPAAERDTVLSVSAGLPKKDWPLLFDALGRLPGVPRRVVVGVTAGWTQLPQELAELASTFDDPPLVHTNLTRPEVHALLARTALLVYTLHPDIRFGMPMSVVEALCAGCSVVLPDRPECRDFAGPGFRGYITAEEIARHAREVLAGGPAIQAQRRAGMAYARERFCGPEHGERFHLQLREGLEALRTGAAQMETPA